MDGWPISLGGSIGTLISSLQEGCFTSVCSIFHCSWRSCCWTRRAGTLAIKIKSSWARVIKPILLCLVSSKWSSFAAVISCVTVHIIFVLVWNWKNHIKYIACICSHSVFQCEQLLVGRAIIIAAHTEITLGWLPIECQCDVTSRTSSYREGRWILLQVWYMPPETYLAVCSTTYL